MVILAEASVVLVHFPFSDLSASKLRPAVVLASAAKGDWILCQVTSNSYADFDAIAIDDVDFLSGGLHRASYVRPGKLFTANISLIDRSVGALKSSTHRKIVQAVVEMLTRGMRM